MLMMLAYFAAVAKTTCCGCCQSLLSCTSVSTRIRADAHDARAPLPADDDCSPGRRFQKKRCSCYSLAFAAILKKRLADDDDYDDDDDGDGDDEARSAGRCCHKNPGARPPVPAL